MIEKKPISRKINLILLSVISISLLEILLFMQCDKVGWLFKSLAQVNTILLLIYPAALAASLILTTISYFNHFKQKSIGRELLPRKLAMPYLILFIALICISRLVSISVCVK